MKSLLAALLLTAPAFAQIECPPFLSGSVLNGAFLGPDWVIVTGSFSWTVQDPGTCPDDPCVFVWKVDLQIHSRTPAASPILELCTFVSYPTPAHCGPFPIPGITQGDGTFLQVMETEQRFSVACGHMLELQLNWNLLFGAINFVKVTMLCGGNCPPV